VGIKVNKLSSTKTQLPYEYYSLPFCQPETIVNKAENLGEARPRRRRRPCPVPSRAAVGQVMRGDRIENSVYTARGAGRSRVVSRS